MNKTYSLSDYEISLIWPWLDGREEIHFSKDLDLSPAQQEALYNILDAYREDMDKDTEYLFETLVNL